MSRPRIVLLALLVVVLFLAAAAGVVAWSARPKKVAVGIEVTGPQGMPLKGTVEVDGVTQELTGTVPAKFGPFEGKRVLFALTTTADSGEFRAFGSINGARYGGAPSTDPPKYGVRSWVKSDWGWSEPRYWIESFEKEGNPPWKLAPPP
jgi:hypothetical protein